MSRFYFSKILAYIFFVQLSLCKAEEKNTFIFDYIKIFPGCSSNMVIKIDSASGYEKLVNVELNRRRKTTLIFTFNNIIGSPNVHITGLPPDKNTIGTFQSFKICGNRHLSVVNINSGIEKSFSYPYAFKYFGIDAEGENVYFEFADSLLLKYDLSKDLITEIFMKKEIEQKINSLVKSKEGYYSHYEYYIDGKLFKTAIDYDYYERLTITDNESGELLMEDSGGALIPIGEHELYYCAPCCWESKESLYSILNTETLKKTKIQNLPCPNKTGSLMPHPHAGYFIYLGWSLS